MDSNLEFRAINLCLKSKLTRQLTFSMEFLTIAVHILLVLRALVGHDPHANATLIDKMMHANHVELLHRTYIYGLCLCEWQNN